MQKERPTPTGEERSTSLRRQVGERLALLRERRGLTQAQLAERLGWLPYRVSRYECGTHLPPVEALLALSGVLDVSVDLMLTGRQRGVQSAALLQRVRALERLPQDELARALKVLDGYLDGSTPEKDAGPGGKEKDADDARRGGRAGAAVVGASEG